MIKTGEAVDHKKDEKGYKVKIQMYTDEEFRRWQVPPERRRAVMELARARKVDLLFCTNLAREGLDLPHLCVGHMITPKKGDQQSRKDGAAVEQEIGRIMRADPGNPAKKAYWFDYVDYAVGVFKEHYYSRRKVYKRLGFTVPAKPREEKDDIEDFLGKMVW
jgi:superfamily II DNA or RNA helicase